MNQKEKVYFFHFSKKDQTFFSKKIPNPTYRGQNEAEKLPDIDGKGTKMCCVLWKNSEIGPTPAPLRISRFELDDGQGGRRVS